MEEKKVSTFQYFGGKLKKASLFECLTSNKYKEEVMFLRRIEDKEQRDKLKARLPLFTPSGMFRRFSDDGLVEHSGYMCLDFDGKDNPNIRNWTDFVRFLATIPIISFAGISASGKGAFALVPIAYPDKHKEHFRALQVMFRDTAKIDEQCSNVSRARYFSYNEQPYINYYADDFDDYINEPQQTKVTSFNVAGNVGKLLLKIVETGTNITKDRKDWIHLAYAFRNYPDGRNIFHQLSSMDERYNFAESDKVFDYAVKTGSFYDERKFFQICKQKGIVL